MHYYNLMICLLEGPNLASEIVQPYENAQRMLVAAKIRLETLLRLYYLRHGFGSYDIFMIGLTSFLGFLHLNTLKDAEPPEAEIDTVPF